MSVEAVTWALNFAPIPMDKGKKGAAPKPNPACAAVLIGLANHADPDGTAAFPSVQLLMIYSRCSERTVRTALDRLEADGVISPCDPDVIAAKIKRADRRPNGWDLNMHLLRGDLTPDDVRLLSRQFPWLPAALQSQDAAAETERAPDQQEHDGVQPLHPVIPGSADEVQPLHPAQPDEVQQSPDGVQPLQERGATVAPEPPCEPSRNSPYPFGVGGDARPHADAPPRAIPDDPAAAQQDTTKAAVDPTAEKPKQQRGRSKGKGAHPLPEDWAPTERMLADAAQRYPHLDLDHETANWRDTHIGKGSEWKDWGLCWWKWIREEGAKPAKRRRRPQSSDFSAEVQDLGTRLATWWWSLPRRGTSMTGGREELQETLTVAIGKVAADKKCDPAVAGPLVRAALVKVGKPCPPLWILENALNGHVSGGPAKATAAEITAALTRDAAQDVAVETSTGADLAVAVANLANLTNRSSEQGILDAGDDTPHGVVLPGKVIG